MTFYNDFKDYINDTTMPNIKPRVKIKYEHEVNPNKALDDIHEQLNLLDDDLEQYINKLKGKDVVITFQDVGPGKFNEQRYNDDCRAIETRHAQLQLQVSDPNKTTAEKRAILDEIGPLKRPDKNDPKYLEPTTVINAINVKEAYKRLKIIALKWKDSINDKKLEINVANRKHLQAENNCLLKDNNCMKAIVALFQYPDLLGKDGIIDGVIYKDPFGIEKQDMTIYKFKMAYDRNPFVFNDCKTIIEYNERVNEGAFDEALDDIHISREDELALAKRFIANSGLLDSRSVETIREFAKRKEDDRCSSEIEELVKAHTLD